MFKSKETALVRAQTVAQTCDNTLANAKIKALGSEASEPISARRRRGVLKLSMPTPEFPVVDEIAIDEGRECRRRPLKSCKTRVPTPFQPRMLGWLDEKQVKEITPILSCDAFSGGLKPCKDRVPTPYANPKEWLDDFKF